MLEVIALYNGQVPEVAQLKEVIGWRCPRYLQVRIPVMIDQVIRPDSRQLYVTREWKIVGPIHLNQPKNEEAGLMDGQIGGMTQHGAPERHLSDKGAGIEGCICQPCTTPIHTSVSAGLVHSLSNP